MKESTSNDSISILGVANNYLINFKLSPLILCSPDCRWESKDSEGHSTPCGAPGKVPHTKNWQRFCLNLPTYDGLEADLQRFLKFSPNGSQPNVGIATGKASQSIVFDIDDPETQQWFIESGFVLPDTPTVKTGRLGGGWQFWFAYDPQIESQDVNLGNGISFEIKSDGKQIVVPPSLHVSGSRYQWLVPFDRDKLRPIPPELLKHIKQQYKTASKTTETPDGEIPEGQRNQTLFEIGCAMRRRGATEASIQAALLQENTDRCNPPLSDDEVKRTAASAAKYDPTITTVDAPGHAHYTYDPNHRSVPNTGTVTHRNGDTTDNRAQPPPDLVFPESAFRGIFEVYLEAVKGRNEVCDSYHFAVLKTLVGSILGRGAYLYTGSRIYPNFYTCLIGATGISRKTTALSMGRDILQRIDPNVITFNGLATPEGLIAKLTIPSADDDDDEKFPDPTLQPRIDATSEYEGFRTLVGLSEYAALLKKAKKSSSDGLIQVLTDAFDCPPALDNPTRHSPLKAVNPCMSIVALSTQSWLEESLNLEDIRGGFANRFCYYLHDLTPPVPRPTQPDEKLLGALIETVHKIREYYQKRHIEFNFDDETGEFVDNWYGENRQAILTEKNELVRDTMQRLDSNARKLALLYAILENGADDHQIHLVHFETALKVATYWKDAMQQIFGLFTKDQQTKNENVIVQRLGTKSRTKRELRMSISRQMNSKQFNDALDALVKSERIGEVSGKLTLLD